MREERERASGEQCRQLIMSMQTAATRTEKRHRLMAYPDRCRPPGRTGACAAFSKIQSEEFRKIAGRQNFPGISSFPCERKLSAGAADESLFVQLVKPKEELGLAVEAGPPPPPPPRPPPPPHIPPPPPPPPTTP